MDFLVGMGVGWGIGIVFGINLSKLIWYPESESIWDRHAMIRKGINKATTHDSESNWNHCCFCTSWNLLHRFFCHRVLLRQSPPSQGALAQVFHSQRRRTWTLTRSSRAPCLNWLSLLFSWLLVLVLSCWSSMLSLRKTESTYSTRIAMPRSIRVEVMA